MNRNHAKAYRVLKKVARQEGLTVDAVIAEINESIRQAYADACRTGKSEVVERWRQVPCSGALPDALELLEYLGENARRDGIL